MNTDKRYKPCSSCGSRDGLRITKEYEYCCICGFRKFKNYHYCREWLSDKEHIQWEYWSKSLSEELKKLKELISNEEIDNALHLIEDRLVRWEQNWKPYKDLKEDIKDFDREWADKILDALPFKCPVHQCGGEMIPQEREPPETFIESEHFDGDEQTPDLICDNCGAIYQFKGFNKPEVNQCDFSQNNKKEDGIPPTNKLVGILPKRL